MKPRRYFVGVSAALGFAVLAAGCAEAEGLALAPQADVTVKFDFDARPLPDIPLPNDIATRYDPSSATGLRLNASQIAPTNMESRVRGLVDQLDGWGLQQPIAIPFTGPIDVEDLLSRHRDADYDLSDDAVYLINVDENSDQYGRIHHLDVGQGNYPIGIEALHRYGLGDPRGWTLSLAFEEEDEDKNHNGEMDPGERDENHNGIVDIEEDRNQNGWFDPPEDTDADGVLDRPNYAPGLNPVRADLAGRADALMSFYERETNTLLVSPMVPLLERTTYAVVVTRRLLDEDGDPVGSPFKFINHVAQTDALRPLLDVLPEGVDLEDIAFTWPFTTQTAESDWVAIRDGLYGQGVQAHIGEQFPPVLSELSPLKDVDHPANVGKNPYLLHTEEFADLFDLVASQLLGVDLDSEQAAALIDSQEYVDYHVMGTYESPQLYDRFDAEGNRIPLDLQSWPSDLALKAVGDPRPETVFWWLVMPRKEVSARGQGQPVPVVLLGHGYTGNRVGETLGFSGFLAQYGLATLAMDNVGHGLSLGQEDTDLLVSLFGNLGFMPLVDVVLQGRAEDLDGDGNVDSGNDFWTSYLFHTRDNMRQSALDYMQMIRIIRSWDGEKRWPFDVGWGPHSGLAGDFDGDGSVDVGTTSPIHAMGGSLGGIMSTILGGADPEMDSIIPIAGGGRLTDVGNRSLQGGVPQAVIQRVMGPFYRIQTDESGHAEIFADVVALNKENRFKIAEAEGVLPGDTIVVHNLTTGERGCGYLLPSQADPEHPQAHGFDDEGHWALTRVPIASDEGDDHLIELYRGPALELDTDECVVLAEHEPRVVIDEMTVWADEEGSTPTYLGEPIFDAPSTAEPGQGVGAGPLRAITEGLGLPRDTPSLRRFMSIGQLVVDPADPAVFARHFHDAHRTRASEKLVFATGGEVDTRALVVTTVGDMNVPANSGVTVGRAAGYINYLQPMPEYGGLPQNQVVLETFTAEAVHSYKRHTFNEDPEADGVHFDVENLSGDTDRWAGSLPRLDGQGCRWGWGEGGSCPPLRQVNDFFWDVDPQTNQPVQVPLPHTTGSVFTYAVPSGQHGFALPGEETDRAISQCIEQGGTEEDCEADVGQYFDVGWTMFHTIGTFATQRTQSPFGDACNTKNACGDIPPTPPRRDVADLP